MLGWCVEPIMIFPMTPSPYFSIIIVNFRSFEVLTSSLRALFSLEGEEGLFEVIVVNNDESEQRAVEQLAGVYPLRILESGSNVGFGQGANSAVSLARGQVLGFLNPDTEWQETCLVRLREFYQKQSKPVIVGIPLTNEVGVPESWSKGFAPSLWRLMYNNMPWKWHQEGRLILDWVSGGSLFLPKELFLRLGGFSQDFFLYFEDVDLCVRAKQLGASVMTAPFGRIWHSGGKSFSSHSQKKRSYYTSQITYFRKHRPVGEYLFVRFFHRFFHHV